MFHVLYYRRKSLSHAMNRENLGRAHSQTGQSGEDISWPLPETEFTLQNVSPKVTKKKPYPHTHHQGSEYGKIMALQTTASWE
jgi:hypothetical protein